MSADFCYDLAITIFALVAFYVIGSRLEWRGGEVMAIRDYWLYQKRDTPVPWAIYFVKEYDRRKPAETMLDWTFYHEDIPTPTHSKSFVGLHYDTVSGYVDAITAEMAEYVSVTSQDYEQIERELYRILV